MSATIDEIQQRLVNSNLLSADEAAQKLSQWQASADGQPPEAFIDWLVTSGCRWTRPAASAAIWPAGWPSCMSRGSCSATSALKTSGSRRKACRS